MLSERRVIVYIPQEKRLFNLIGGGDEGGY